MRYDIKVVNNNGHRKYLMHKDDSWKWSANENVKKNFQIEYVDNEIVWDNIVAEKYENPWEWYTLVEFETMWDAMEFYLFKLYSDKVYDIKMYCQTYVNDRMILEETFEFDTTFYHEFSKRVNEAAVKRRDKALKKLEELEKKISIYEGFIDKYNSRNIFDNYIQEQGVLM